MESGGNGQNTEPLSVLGAGKIIAKRAAADAVACITRMRCAGVVSDSHPFPCSHIISNLLMDRRDSEH